MNKTKSLILTLVLISLLFLCSCYNNSEDYDQGYNDGYEEGYFDGYDEGYNEGVDAAVDDMNTEIGIVEDAYRKSIVDAFYASYKGTILQSNEIFNANSFLIRLNTETKNNNLYLRHDIKFQNDDIAKYIEIDNDIKVPDFTDDFPVSVYFFYEDGGDIYDYKNSFFGENFFDEKIVYTSDRFLTEIESLPEGIKELYVLLYVDSKPFSFIYKFA